MYVLPHGVLCYIETNHKNDAGVERFPSGLRSFQCESGLIDSFKRNTNLENCTQRAHQRHLKNFCGIIETSNLRGFSYVFPQERFPTNDSFRSCTFRTNCQRTEGVRTFQRMYFRALMKLVSVSFIRIKARAPTHR